MGEKEMLQLRGAANNQQPVMINILTKKAKQRNQSGALSEIQAMKFGWMCQKLSEGSGSQSACILCIHDGFICGKTKFRFKKLPTTADGPWINATAQMPGSRLLLLKFSLSRWAKSVCSCEGFWANCSGCPS
mmetsp:Transcript_23473/g.47630  ORF Transcript_23473/g.47630 Transcript_23473/m.47630 type:complete len:132 (+) Transcript_23473:1586-1981(+)